MKQYKYTINGAQFDVTIDSIVGSKAKVEVNGIPFEVEMQGSSLVEEALPTVTTDGAAPAAAPAAPAAAAAPAAIGAFSENAENFGKSLIFVALGEGVAIYGLLISILIINTL